MSGDRLTPLQRRILRVLAHLEPPWTLTGGAALAGFHLGHRATRDLDLFWRNRTALGELSRDALRALREAGLEAEVLRSSPAFAQLRAASSDDACIVDLVAEPTDPLEPPEQLEVDDSIIAVDSRHEILVSKLTTLLNRSELRDLVDVKALLEAGEDLTRALNEAPDKDGGFSALTLAWVLESLDPGPLARALDWTEAQIGEITAFKKELVARLTAAAAPE